MTGEAASARKMEADPEGIAFMLSETLPIVPAKIAEKIIKRDYMEISTKFLKIPTSKDEKQRILLTF